LAELSIVTVARPTHSEKTVSSPPQREKPTKQSWAGGELLRPDFLPGSALVFFSFTSKGRRGAHPETRSESDFQKKEGHN
jgi:hypothetical protein